MSGAECMWREDSPACSGSICGMGIGKLPPILYTILGGEHDGAVVAGGYALAGIGAAGELGYT